MDLTVKHLASMGGKARAASLTQAKRSDSARLAALARWSRLTAEERSEQARRGAATRRRRKPAGR